MLKCIKCARKPFMAQQLFESGLLVRRSGGSETCPPHPLEIRAFFSKYALALANFVIKLPVIRLFFTGVFFNQFSFSFFADVLNGLVSFGLVSFTGRPWRLHVLAMKRSTTQ